MYKFNASFRKSAAAVATELGLEFISTKRQIENGTLMFNDPETNVKYAMYESGYVRRLTPIGNCPWGNSQTINERGHQMYQLNKTRHGVKTTTYNGKAYTCHQKIRILANPDEQLGIFAKSIVNYRNK
jgi:hypothetical protein